MTYELYAYLFTMMTAGGLLIWAVYELVQCFHSRPRWAKPDILPKPRQDRVVQTYKDHWKVELITKGDYK